MEKGSDLQTGGQVTESSPASSSRGFVISKRHWVLRHERKQAICSIPRPNTKKEICEFLRVARFCRIWIPGFSEVANPLFKARAGSDKDPQSGDLNRKRPSRRQRLLTSAPALGLPDVTRDFNLFVREKNHTALGSSHKQLGHGSARSHTCPNDWIQWPWDGHHASGH